MFLFNKGAALPTISRSRQSSTDSGEMDEYLAPSSSHSSTHGDLPSPERRERGPYGRRTSVFALRSRSNTANSTASSFLSRTSTMNGTESSSRRSSQDLQFSESQTNLSEMSLSKSKNPFSRGSKLRRQSSKFAALAQDDVEEMSSSRRASMLRKGRHTKGAGSQSEVSKQLISSPFGFQHLTHTQRQQFPELDRTTQNELVAEFWALRASQVPRRELHGIKAEDLCFQSLSLEELGHATSDEVATPTTARAPSSLKSKGSREMLDSFPSPTAKNKSIRHSRSVEGFSPPSVNPPPRYSSRVALGRMDDVQEQAQDAPSDFSRISGLWDRPTLPVRPSTADSIDTVTYDMAYVPHAVTTPHDQAIPALSPTLGFDLENVPEEPDSYFNPRPAPRPPARRNPSSDLQFRQTFFPPIASAINGVSSEKNEEIRQESQSPKSPKTRPPSQLSDTLGSPFILRPRRTSSLSRFAGTRRQSILLKDGFDSSWETDIDYCYEHAAEADCDYEWDRRSSDGGHVADKSHGEQHMELPLQSPINEAVVGSSDDLTLQTRFFPGVFRPSLLVPSAQDVPDLDHRSALSASTTTTGAGALTPSDIFAPSSVVRPTSGALEDSEGFTILTPSLLVPQDFKFQSMREEMYEDLLEDYESSDRHYPLLDAAAQSISSSSRSSGTRQSKRSSYDSSIKSIGHSASSPVRGSASSTGSLPELVHSRRARKTFDMMVEQLSEQISTSVKLDAPEHMPAIEANNDGSDSASSERTFFAADDDDDDDESVKDEAASIASVGAASSASIPRHERAASDSAAKLLSKASSQAAAPHHRAASSSQPRRGSKAPTYTLSLFPEPPKARRLVN